MDNLGIYIDLRVVEAIEAVGRLVCYLPLYLPDFNPIKLTFSVLKSWIYYNYWFVRPAY